MSEAYDDLVRSIILNDDELVEATFQGAQGKAAVPWQRVTIRPVLIRDERHLQFGYFDGRQEIFKNARGEAAAQRLAELLDLPFKSIAATTTAETIRVQFSKRGRPILHREQHRNRQPIPLDLAHDRSKPTLLSEDSPTPFLEAIGVMTADGRVRADQRRKFRQINEFLRLVDETGEVERIERRPVRVVDLGCGSAALTFATYYYLTELKGIPAIMTGVDTKTHLMERHNETARDLGWEAMRFVPGRILDFEPEEPPDIVLALHACDTATDDALARAVTWGSQLIFSAPCCHHHLQAQLASSSGPEAFRPVLRHGILRERLGDVLTDAFRAHILRLAGYRADVLEFVPVEHTPKNLMIRAVNTHAPVAAALVEEYQALKAYWGVTPHLETLLEATLRPVLGPPDEHAA